MTARFAELQSRVAGAVEKHLADATADFGGGVLVDGLFRLPYGEAFGFVSGTSPSFEATSGALAGIARNASVTINGTTYTVSEIKPDGNGMVTLVLEQVA